MSVSKEISREMLARYILGMANEEERGAIEDAYLASDREYEHLVSVEDELVELYIARELSPDEARRFEEAFLTSPEGRARIALARALMRTAQQGPISTQVSSEGPSGEFARLASSISPTAPSTQAKENPGVGWDLARPRTGWWQSLLASFDLRTFRFQLALAAVAIVAIVLPALYWRKASRHVQNVATARPKPEPVRTIPGSSSPPIRKPPVKAEHRQMTPILALALVPGTRGNQSESNTIRVPANRVRVRLKMRPRSLAYPRYRASIQNVDNDLRWSIPVRRLGTSELFIELSSKDLPLGSYILELKGISPDGTEEELEGYTFFVRPRLP